MEPDNVEYRELTLVDSHCTENPSEILITLSFPSNVQNKIDMSEVCKIEANLSNGCVTIIGVDKTNGTFFAKAFKVSQNFKSRGYTVGTQIGNKILITIYKIPVEAKEDEQRKGYTYNPTQLAPSGEKKSLSESIQTYRNTSCSSEENKCTSGKRDGVAEKIKRNISREVLILVITMVAIVALSSLLFSHVNQPIV
ncbi:unnamed protein product [Cuscuta epithymum]|uniref:Uncharacterized protein n=1 Tax=Cuscuta epithymum TaxID=186058 RepID=A0AAV0FXH1_9ASTE|nr:unnamed protein product [Cuscuta epithymum]